MKSFAVLITIIGILSSCTYNSEEELGVLTPGNIPIEEHEIDYTTTVKPIVLSNCAISSTCHGSGTSVGDFTVDENVERFSEDIYLQVESGRMPKTGSLTFNEKDLLLSWINQGANIN